MSRAQERNGLAWIRQLPARSADCPNSVHRFCQARASRARDKGSWPTELLSTPLWTTNAEYANN